jgi:hypothetical protein
MREMLAQVMNNPIYAGRVELEEDYMSLLITAKQHIYQRMLLKVADYRALGNLDSTLGIDKDWLTDLACQADLLHGIPRAITCPDITDDDVIFLNRHAHHYLSTARSDRPNYRFFKLMIHQLFVLVAATRAHDLRWSGPNLDKDERLMLNLDSE